MKPTLFLLFTTFTLSTSAAHFQMSVAPRGQDKYQSADFSIWVPDGVKTIRAVIVHQHGCGRNGITVPHDLHWQALAKKHDAALMGSYLVPTDKCTDWHEPQHGSERAFLTALKTFATESNHPELEQAPWCLWGHSGGAHWAVAMTLRHPTRVVAAVPRSGGSLPPDGTIDSAVFSVPVLFQLGAREHAPGNRFNKLYDTAAAAFVKGRENSALWSFAADPMSEHDTRHSRLIAIPFFDAALALRLPRDVGEALLPLDAGKGAVLPTEGISATSWLPTQDLAHQWKEFIATGSVKDTTPPPAPHGLRATTTAGQLTLTWESDIDLESGIKAFHLYLDDQRVATLAGPEDARSKSFQSGNYGDEPEPVRPQMQLAVPFKPGRYELTATNHSDLESHRSRPVTIGAK